MCTKTVQKYGVSRKNSTMVREILVRNGGPHRPETWTIVYISVYCNISFSWLLPLDCFLCLLRDSENELLKIQILATRPCVSCLIFAYFLKQNCCQIPLAEWTNEV